jgi:tRNA(Arg) A34 adenosine deaminase TadA
VEISLPLWLEKYEWSLRNKEFLTDEEMMQVAIEISKQNVAHQTGGPFGCAIFEKDHTTGIAKLLSVGANRVTVLNNSTLHGETVAIQFGQKKLQTYSMRQASATTNKEYVMCTSCEPCAMCLGATLWSGVHEIICSATKSDAESIGFNEGPVFDASYQQLEESGIKVKRKILQASGAQVLQDYGKTGLIYNG